MAFNEIMSSLSTSVLFKIYNLFLEFFVPDAKTKFINSISFLASHHQELQDPVSLLSENVIGLLDIMKPVDYSNYMSISSSLLCFALTASILKDEILKYSEYVWLFVEGSLVLAKPSVACGLFINNFVFFWNQLSILIHDLLDNQRLLDDDCFDLFVKLLLLLRCYGELKIEIFDFAEFLKCLSALLFNSNGIVFELILSTSLENILSLRDKYQLTPTSDAFKLYSRIILTLMCSNNNLPCYCTLFSLNALLEFILVDSMAFSCILSIDFISRLNHRLYKIIASTKERNALSNTLRDTILSILALIALIYPKSLSFPQDYNATKQDLFSHSTYIKLLSYEETFWIWIISFIFPFCAQSLRSGSNIHSLPFFICQEIVNNYLSVSDQFSLSEIPYANIALIIPKFSTKDKKKLTYLIQRSKHSKFKISGFQPIDYNPAGFCGQALESPEKYSPEGVLSYLQESIISTIEDPKERYLFSLLRMFASYQLDSFINPAQTETLEITFSEDSLYFSRFFLIYLMTKKFIPLDTCLDTLYRCFGITESFETIYPIIQYFLTSISTDFPSLFIEYLVESPSIPRLELARYFFKSNNFSKALYYFELFKRQASESLTPNHLKFLTSVYQSLDLIDEVNWCKSKLNAITSVYFTQDSELIFLKKRTFLQSKEKNIFDYEIASKLVQKDQYFPAYYYLNAHYSEEANSNVPLFIQDLHSSVAWKLQQWDLPSNQEILGASASYVPALLNSVTLNSAQSSSLLESFSRSLILELSEPKILLTTRFNELNFYYLIFSFINRNEHKLFRKAYQLLNFNFTLLESKEKKIFSSMASSLVLSPSESSNYIIEALKLTRKLNLRNSFKNLISCSKNIYTDIKSPQNQVSLRLSFEECKYLWADKCYEQALNYLQNLILPHEQFHDKDEEEKELQSKLRRKLVKWKLSSQSFNLASLLPSFNEAIQLSPKNENNYYALANFQLRLFSNFRYNQENCSKEEIEWILNAMKNLARVIIVGKKLTNESFSKLLSFWFNVKNELLFSSIHKVVCRLFEKISTSQYCSQLNYLISRICHERQCVYELLSKAILLLFKEYPQPVIWQLLSVCRSSHNLRASRANAILKVAKNTQNLTFLIDSGMNFTEALILVSNSQVTTSKASLQKDFKFIKKLFPTSLQLPSLSCLNFNNPNDSSLMIFNMEDTIEIMMSLQRPKKIALYTQNGQKHVFLCKPKDDLRKDARFMRYLVSIGALMDVNEEASKRKLRVRPYAAIPLNDECGLIEWVHHTTTFRSILNKIYESKKIFVAPKRLKEISAQKKPEKEIFCNDLLPLFPKVFYEWFYFTWSDPHKWIFSRLRYTQSMAIMSIVGWIIGLGDRHGENILLDSVTGEAVHVDFNCLFDKGLSFAKPEVVPFRLTHNMVDAMGLSATEGVFKKCASIILEIIRNNRIFLLRTLEAFIYDPILEWNSKPLKSHCEHDSTEARNTLHTIECKIRGIVGNIPHFGSSFSEEILSLSVDGQISELIKEATSIDNLCRMYIGWAPFM